MSTTVIDAPRDHSAAGVAQLFAGIERRDPGAWDEIVRRYGGLVVARARAHRLQEADVHDAVQMTWLRLAENWRGVQHPERLGSWLTTTVNRECWQILSRNRRIVCAVDAVEGQVDRAVGPEQHAVEADTAAIVRNAVAELPERRRELLVALFYDSPAGYAELSARIGIPVGSIGPTRARSLRCLRLLLDQRGLTADP